MRLFVAIKPNAEVLGRIESALAGLRSKAPLARWVNADSLHLTLAFLGERDMAEAPRLVEALSRAAAGHAPFELCFRGGGGFGRPDRPRVVWVGCEGDLAALQTLCNDVTIALAPFGFTPDPRGFNAHLTLARARERGGDPPLGVCAAALRSADFGCSRIEAITLYESQLSAAGAHHTALSSAPLAAAAG